MIKKILEDTLADEIVDIHKLIDIIVNGERVYILGFIPWGNDKVGLFEPHKEGNIFHLLAKKSLLSKILPKIYDNISDILKREEKHIDDLKKLFAVKNNDGLTPMHLAAVHDPSALTTLHYNGIFSRKEDYLNYCKKYSESSLEDNLSGLGSYSPLEYLFVSGTLEEIKQRLDIAEQDEELLTEIITPEIDGIIKQVNTISELRKEILGEILNRSESWGLGNNTIAEIEKLITPSPLPKQIGDANFVNVRTASLILAPLLAVLYFLPTLRIKLQKLFNGSKSAADDNSAPQVAADIISESKVYENLQEELQEDKSAEIGRDVIHGIEEVGQVKPVSGKKVTWAIEEVKEIGEQQVIRAENLVVEQQTANLTVEQQTITQVEENILPQQVEFEATKRGELVVSKELSNEVKDNKSPDNLPELQVVNLGEVGDKQNILGAEEIVGEPRNQQQQNSYLVEPMPVEELMPGVDEKKEEMDIQTFAKLFQEKLESVDGVKEAAIQELGEGYIPLHFFISIKNANLAFFQKALVKQAKKNNLVIRSNDEFFKSYIESIKLENVYTCTTKSFPSDNNSTSNYNSLELAAIYDDIEIFKLFLKKINENDNSIHNIIPIVIRNERLEVQNYLFNKLQDLDWQAIISIAAKYSRHNILEEYASKFDANITHFKYSNTSIFNYLLRGIVDILKTIKNLKKIGLDEWSKNEIYKNSVEKINNAFKCVKIILNKGYSFSNLEETSEYFYKIVRYEKYAPEVITDNKVILIEYLKPLNNLPDNIRCLITKFDKQCDMFSQNNSYETTDTNKTPYSMISGLVVDANNIKLLPVNCLGGDCEFDTKDVDSH